MKLIAKTQEGLEPYLVEELTHIGASNIEVGKRAIFYEGDTELLYTSNFYLRTALKILVWQKEFVIKDENDLYKVIKDFDWESYITVENTIAVDAVVNSDKFRHANFIALKTKDAIVDRFRSLTGERPSVDAQNPDLQINIHIRQQTVTLSLDSSGKSLHMRGFKKQMVNAPLNEVLAAGLVLASKWDGSTPLLDPMCGSGTILTEAVKYVLQKSPHSEYRNFAFEKWKNFDAQLFLDIKQKYQGIEYPGLKVYGVDTDYDACVAAKYNINEQNLSGYITVEEDDFFYHDGMDNAMIICNPPYDHRIKENDIIQFYKYIGDKLKSSFSGCSAWLLSGHIEAIKNLGLRPSSRKSFINGSIPSVYYRYDMYKGSKKAKFQNDEHEN